MKKILIVLFIAASYSLVAKAQEYFHCEIVGSSKLLSKKVTVEIDMGQATKLFSDRRLRDEKGNIVVFNSMVDAMNYMGADGWEFMQAYAVTIDSQNVYHWLLRKRLDLLTPEERTAVLEKLKTTKPSE